MNDRGSVLILAVWAVSVFSVMTASLAFHGGQEMLLMKREIRGLKSRADFISGLSEAFRRLQEDPDPHEDSKDKSWFGAWKSENSLQSRFSVRMEDEESKINLNQASAALLSTFLKEFESENGSLKGDRKAYLKAILKLRYTKRIESLEELLLLDDFVEEDFEPLKTYLTVYPEQLFINPNTASPLVLRALVQSLGADHASKEILMGRLEEACPKQGCFFRNSDLEPEALAERLKLPKTPLMLQVIQEFLAALTLDSQTFHIEMKSIEGATAAGVFSCRTGQVRPEIVWWHENV